MPYKDPKKGNRERYLRNKDEILRKAKENREKHRREREHAQEVYPLLLSIAKYDRATGLVNNKIRKFTLKQAAISSFLADRYSITLSRPTVGNYIDDLVTLGLIERSGKHNYVNENVPEWWRKDSQLYTADILAIDKYCKKRKYKISETLLYAYRASLKNENSDEFLDDLEIYDDKEEWIDKNKALFPEYEAWMTEINGCMPSKCQLRFLWNGCGRLVNPLAVLPNPEKDYHTKEEKEKRPEMLKKQFGIKDYIEYDVGASIYRLTYNLNHVIPFYENLDIYELFWKLMSLEGALHKDGEINNDIGFHDSDEREHLKKMVMPIYMDEYSIKYSVIFVYAAVIKRYSLKSYSETVKRLEKDETIMIYMVDNEGNKIKDRNGKTKYHKVNKSEREKFIAWSFFVEHYLGWDTNIKTLTNKLIAFLEKLKKAMKVVLFESTEHKFYQRDIFIFESCLHILMFKEFLSYEELFTTINKRKILQIIDAYDGFYGSNAFTKEMFQKAYHKATYQLKVELNDKKIEDLYINSENVIKAFPIKRIRDGAKKDTLQQSERLEGMANRLKKIMDAEA